MGDIRKPVAVGVLGLLLASAVGLAPSSGLAAFDDPITISPADTDSLLPQVAVAASGAALIIWQMPGPLGPPLQIRARMRSAAGVLGPVRTLTSGVDALNARVGIDADGDAVVVWERLEAGVTRLQARSFSKTGALGPVVFISPPGAQDARVAVDANGDALIVWERTDGSLFRIQGRALSRTGVLGPLEALSPVGGEAIDPRVVVEANGDALVVWERDDPGGDLIQARARSNAGLLGPVLNLSESGRHARDPHVAMDADGDAFIVWDRPVPPSDVSRIQGRARTKGGVLRPIMNLSPDSSSASESQVAIDAEGDVLVVWQRVVGTLQIEARSRSSGGVLGPVQRLSGAGSASHPVVASDAGGDSVVVWERTAAATNIQARTRSAGGALSAIQTLSGPAASQAQAGVDADGDAVVVWRRTIDDEHRIQFSAGP